MMTTKQTVSFVFLGIALIFGANAMDPNRGGKEEATVSPDRNPTSDGSTEKGRKKSVPGGYGPGADARKAQKALALANAEFVRRGFLAPAKPPNGNNTMPQTNETSASALQEVHAQSKAAVAHVDTTATALTDVAKEGDNVAGSKATVAAEGATTKDAANDAATTEATVAGEEATTKDSANDAAETEATASVADEAGPALTESGTKQVAEGKATTPVADKAGEALTEVGTEEAGPPTSSDDVSKIVVPMLKDKGEPYKKFRLTFVRQARAGETVKTWKNGELEASKVAIQGDWVVQALSKEQYIMSDADFREYYDHSNPMDVPADRADLRDEGFNAYKSKRRVLAIQIDDEILKELPGQRFVTPWKKEMHLEPGDFLFAATKNDESMGEIQGMDKRTFGETYTPDVSKIVGLMLKDKGTPYKKRQRVFIRKAAEGERVTSLVHGDHKPSKIAHAGDWIAQAAMPPYEPYILSESKFHERYDYRKPMEVPADHEDAEDLKSKGFQAYNPTRQILAIKVDDEILAKIPGGGFIAEQGQKMSLKPGDFLLASTESDGSVGEVRGMEEADFGKIYTPDVGEIVEPMLKAKGEPYKKTQRSFARRATEGEKVETWVGGEFKFSSKAGKEDWIVQAETTRKEQHILPGAEFHANYDHSNPKEPVPHDGTDLRGFEAYNSKRQFLAIEVDEKILGKIPSYIASRGEEITLMQGDFFVGSIKQDGSLEKIKGVRKADFDQNYVRGHEPTVVG